MTINMSETSHPPYHRAIVNNNPRLKTLYLTGYGTTLAKKQERFVVKQKGEVLKQIPAIHVDQIMVFGSVQLTTQVMQYCLKQSIPVYFLSGSGHYYGVLDNHDTHSIYLHRQQYLKAENTGLCLQVAKQLIKGKLGNSDLLLRRLARSQNKHTIRIQQAAQEIGNYTKQLDAATDLNQLRGIEGMAARTYFQTLSYIIDPKWHFNGRNKQPPTDPVNALLSYGYTLLFHNVYSFLKSAGLNPHIGFLHAPRRGHPALASDLMEEFRSVIVDAVVFSLVLNDKLMPDDFELAEKQGHACHMSSHARKIFIHQIETKLNTGITHPVNGDKIDYRRCIEHQIKHFASLIRGNEEPNRDKPSLYQPAIFR